MLTKIGPVRCMAYNVSASSSAQGTTHTHRLMLVAFEATATLPVREWRAFAIGFMQGLRRANEARISHLVMERGPTCKVFRFKETTVEEVGGLYAESL